MRTGCAIRRWQKQSSGLFLTRGPLGESVLSHQTNKDLRKQVLICLCLCPQGTTSFCNYSYKHHFEHSENIVVRETDTKRSCDFSQTVLCFALIIYLRINNLLILLIEILIFLKINIQNALPKTLICIIVFTIKFNPPEVMIASFWGDLYKHIITSLLRR